MTVTEGLEIARSAVPLFVSLTTTSGVQVFNRAAVDVARCAMPRIWNTRTPAHATSIAIEKRGVEIWLTVLLQAAEAL